MTQEQVTVAIAEMTVPCPGTGIQLPSFCVPRTDDSVLTLQRPGFSVTPTTPELPRFLHTCTHTRMHAHKHTGGFCKLPKCYVLRIFDLG